MARKKQVAVEFITEIVPLKTLSPHPRNYRDHPDDQLEHIKESIRANGYYRPIVTARDGTILAGHGVAKASAQLGQVNVPIRRMDLDPEEPAALKILAGDNEMSKLAMPDDRILTELLDEIARNVPGDDALLGTGFDNEKLAALLFVTRPMGEIRDFDAASEWTGLPEFDPSPIPPKMVIQFRNDDDREKFVAEFDILVNKKFTKHAPVWSAWWPARPRRDVESIKFVSDTEQAEVA